MMMKRRHRRAVSLVGTALLAALGTGCGDDGTGPGDGPFTANFTATVSGVVSRSYSGVAVFGSGTDPDTGESAWVVYLATGADNPQAATDVIYFIGSGTASEGSKTLYDLDSDFEDLPASGALGLVVMSDNSTGTFGSFGSEGGQLNVTDLSSSRMDGTFTFTATGTVVTGQDTTEGTITVQGSFQAEGGPFLFPVI